MMENKYGGDVIIRNFKKNGIYMDGSRLNGEKVGLEEEIESSILNFKLRNDIILNSSQENNLQTIISNSIKNNRYFAKKFGCNSINLIETPDDFIEVCELRAKVFEDMGYAKNYENYLSDIKGLLYDDDDMRSVILMNKKNDQIIGTVRAVFDNPFQLLPSEFEGADFNSIRKNKKLAEVGRMVISSEHRGKGNDFFNLISQLYILSMDSSIDDYVFVVQDDHEKLYYSLGSKVKKISSIEKYGDFEHGSVVFAWSPIVPSKILLEKGKLKYALDDFHKNSYSGKVA